MEVIADWFDTGKLIEAAETEDEIGVVLRMHLALDKILNHYLRTRISCERARYIKIPKYTGQKIPIAAALDLPISFLAAAHELNKIRNDLAHDNGALTKDNVAQFARQVDSIKAIDPSFHPLAKRYVEFSSTMPGDKIGFGTAGARVDFLIASFALLATMARWMVEQDSGGAV